jgi:hypothetical protein
MLEEFQRVVRSREQRSETVEGERLCRAKGKRLQRARL